MTWSLRIRVWWMFLMSHLYRLEAATWRGVWIWVGHLGISFRRSAGGFGCPSSGPWS
jgi:hypothetical protein